VSAAAERDVWAPFRSLVGGQGVSVVLGLLFWVLAARVVPAAEVGVAAAAISTQTLLGLVGSLGVGTHLVTQLPQRGARRRALLLRGLAVVALAGALLGAGVVLVAQLAGGR
jgi:O-antigen/teichoic acid export membrane protein